MASRAVNPGDNAVEGESRAYSTESRTAVLSFGWAFQNFSNLPEPNMKNPIIFTWTQ